MVSGGLSCAELGFWTHYHEFVVGSHDLHQHFVSFPEGEGGIPKVGRLSFQRQGKLFYLERAGYPKQIFLST